MSNGDAIDFIINMDNRKTLGFSGYEQVRYVDVTSGGKRMKMIVPSKFLHVPRLSCRQCFLKYLDSNDPIRGIIDNVLIVMYHNGPNGWIDATMINSGQKKPHDIKQFPFQWLGILIAYNFCGHNLDEQIFAASECLCTTINCFFRI